ncbi:MAG: DUF6171 family protein [Lachnospiraceae bacterium]|nr:DUF6171 family protein [Lachnospiraceae bacterium]
MEKRYCRKCLLAELDDEKLAREVKDAIERLDAKTRVSDPEYKNRLDICRDCDYLNEATCGACGCYVELRAAAKSGRCPYKKWK